MMLGRGSVKMWFAVSPNEVARETPYIRYHIDATRRAWGLDKVVGRDLSGEVQLDMSDIRANSATVSVSP